MARISRQEQQRKERARKKAEQLDPTCDPDPKKAATAIVEKLREAKGDKSEPLQEQRGQKEEGV